jgi:hypothetical protein
LKILEKEWWEKLERKIRGGGAFWLYARDLWSACTRRLYGTEQHFASVTIFSYRFLQFSLALSLSFVKLIYK